MHRLRLAILALLAFGAVVSGGTSYAQTTDLALDMDVTTPGVQNTATLGAGTHTVAVVITNFAATSGTLAGYTAAIDIGNTAVLGGNPVTLSEKTGFGLATVTDLDASDGRVRVGRGGLAEVTVTTPFVLFEITFTVLSSADVTLTIPNPSPTIVELGNLTQFSIPISSVTGGSLTTGVVAGLQFPYFPGFDIVNDIETYNAGEFRPEAIYLLDGWGAAHKIAGQSSSAPFFNPAYFPGRDWIADLEILDASAAGGAGNESSYMLDRFGAVHSSPSAPFGDQVYFFDSTGLAPVATDFEPFVSNAQVVGGWVLDEFGNVWAVGAAPGAGGPAILSLGLPGRATDPEVDSEGAANDLYAVDLAVVDNGAGGVVLDSFGILHSFGSVDQIGPNLMFGYNIARDLWVNAAGDGAIVLDGFGAVHPLGNVDTTGVDAILASSPYFPNLDIARDLELFQDVSGSIRGAYILDGYGAIHLTGGALYPDAN